MDFIVGAVWGFIFGMLVAVMLMGSTSPSINGIRDAVAECQKELPRHLSCEPVYSARVKQ